jgi:hypothetical protein
MYQGEDTKPRPFKTLIPVGWYLTEFSAVRLDSIDCSKRYESEDIEVVTRVVMVFEHEMANFRMLIDHLENSKRFREIDSYFEEIEDEIYNMREKFFPNWHDHFVQTYYKIYSTSVGIFPITNLPLSFSDLKIESFTI